VYNKRLLRGADSLTMTCIASPRLHVSCYMCLTDGASRSLETTHEEDFSRSSASDSRIESYLIGKCRRVSPHKPAAVPSQHRIFIASSIGHAQLYVKNNSRAASITNKPSNSSAKTRVGCPSSDFSTIFGAAFASPPFPSSPGISIQIVILRAC
jgi:hypothetical protein